MDGKEVETISKARQRVLMIDDPVPIDDIDATLMDVRAEVEAAQLDFQTDYVRSNTGHELLFSLSVRLRRRPEPPWRYLSSAPRSSGAR